MINKAYRNRHEDDLNIPLSVQPWGSDGDKRRYYLIEGNDDTSFRVYRESNPAGLQRTWWSVAGSIDELKALAEKLETQDGGPKAKALAKKIQAAIPRFEATEEKRRRREYRQMRKEQFRRPEGFSLYEGRTRGKRIKYTFSDDENDFFSDEPVLRRSSRNTRNHTPAPSGPITTASGRQVKPPNRLNAETASTGAPSAATSFQGDTSDAGAPRTTRSGRPLRSAAAKLNGFAGGRKRKSSEFESDESEVSEPDFGDDEEEDEHVPDETEEYDEDEEFEDAELSEDDLETTAIGRSTTDAGRKKSLIIKFPIRVEFDENHKVRQIPGPPGEKRPSDEEKTETAPVQPNPAEETISVATTKCMTPVEADKPMIEKVQAISGANNVCDKTVPEPEDKPLTDAPVGLQSPPTPTSEPATSLALRGSPEVTRTGPPPTSTAALASEDVSMQE